MEREIEFRGKDIKTKEWHYGSLLSKYDVDACDYCEYHILEKYGYTRSCDWDSDLVNLDFYEVDENTLGQYVGLKDKNGNKLYEGDIIKNNYGSIYVVKYFDDWSSFSLKLVFLKSEGKLSRANGRQHLYKNDCHLLEIIGNIYDNNELLD